MRDFDKTMGSTDLSYGTERGENLDSGVQRQVHTLAKELDMLGEALDSLCAQLGPILTDAFESDRPTSIADTMPPVPTSPLAREVLDLADRLRRIRSVVSEIKGRVNL